MAVEFYNLIVESILNMSSSLGYLGLFLLMTLESSLFPFPSEVVLIPAGVLVQRGEMSLLLVLAFGVLGSVGGALINYFLAMHLGRRVTEKLMVRYGRFLLIGRKGIEKSERYFREHGEITTFVGRLIPGVRQLISLPAGFAKMDLKKFVFYTTLGSGVWSFILIYAGFLFGENMGLIEENFKVAGLIAITIALLAASIYFYVKTHSKSFRVAS